MFSSDAPYSTLTRLTRLAQRRPKTAPLLEGVFRGRLEELSEVALEVAVETGDPIGRVLAVQIRESSSIELAERLVERCEEEDYQRSVPLREMALPLCQCT